MNRTPIVVPGQVYLHSSAFTASPDAFIRMNQDLAPKGDSVIQGLNEYLVVTNARQGDITYAGVGFSGNNEVQVFLDRFGPVDPKDLTEEESFSLKALLPGSVNFAVGWVPPDDEDNEDEYDVTEEPNQ